jgi:hypothetical protein
MVADTQASNLARPEPATEFKMVAKLKDEVVVGVAVANHRKHTIHLSAYPCCDAWTGTLLLQDRTFSKRKKAVYHVPHHTGVVREVQIAVLYLLGSKGTNGRPLDERRSTRERVWSFSFAVLFTKQHSPIQPGFGSAS